MIHSFDRYSLKHYNTFGIDSIAQKMVIFETINDLVTYHGDLTKGLVLGGGSNIVFVQPEMDQVLLPKITGKEIIEETDEYVLLRVHAGENWHELVQWTMRQDLGGLENLSLIPGSAGAAPIQNIGAYGVELKDRFVSLSAMQKSDRSIVKFNLEQCDFGYRSSVFKKDFREHYIILSIDLRLTKGLHELNVSYGAIQEELEKFGVLKSAKIQDVSQAVMNIRKRKLYDPAEVGNCGSFFKNPIISAAALDELRLKFTDIKYYPVDNGSYKIPAGWLIESLGWKGKSAGNASVSPKHALVIINKGRATGLDVLNLSNQIMDSVKDKYQITLEREVNMI